MKERDADLGKVFKIILVILAIFSYIYVFKTLNIKNTIIGSWYQEPNITQAAKFEYSVSSLLFTNSGTNKNEYFADAHAPIVEDFDKNKRYNITINGIEANRVAGNYSYVNANFTNKFISANNKEILTDTLNIKINFYTDGTRILFLTNQGEKSVDLWSSFIAKNGLVIKVIEDNYIPQMEADNIPTFTINLYDGETLLNSIETSAITTRTLPLTINGKNVKKWLDSEGNIYTTTPLKNIDLYAEFYVPYTINFYSQDELIETIIYDFSGEINFPVEYNGFEIVSWQDENGNYYTETNLPEQNINLYANFNTKKFNVSFNRNTITKIRTDYSIANTTHSDAVLYARYMLNTFPINDVNKTFFDDLGINSGSFSFTYTITNFYDNVNSFNTTRRFAGSSSSGVYFKELIFVKRNDKDNCDCEFDVTFYRDKNSNITIYLDFYVYKNEENYVSFKNDIATGTINFDISFSIFDNVKH